MHLIVTQAQLSIVNSESIVVSFCVFVTSSFSAISCNMAVMAGVAKKLKFSFASQETPTIEIEEIEEGEKGTDPITKENETVETVQVTRDIEEIEEVEEDIVDIVQGTGGKKEAAGAAGDHDEHDERRRPCPLRPLGPLVPLPFAPFHLRSDADTVALARQILPTRDVDDDDNDSCLSWPSSLPPRPPALAPAPTPAPAPVASAPVGRPSVVININQHGNGIMQVSTTIDSSGAINYHMVRR